MDFKGNFIMKKFLFIFIVIILGCSSPKLNKLDNNSVILSFGDSLTYGTGASENGDYPAVLSKMLNIEVVNEGIPGEISMDGLERLPGVLEEINPQLVILCHGGNDMLRKLGREKMAENVSEMIELIQAKGADVILLGVPKPGIFLNTAEEYGEIAEKYAIPYLEDVITDVLSDKSMKSDAIHPNDEGYKIIAEDIYDLIKAAKALP